MNHASEMGMYESCAADEYVDYIRPQEHGNHYNVKYLDLGDYKFVARDAFEFSVSLFSTEELDRKNHNFELVPNGYSNVRIDYKMSGIGSASCGIKAPISCAYTAFSHPEKSNPEASQPCKSLEASNISPSKR